MDSNKDEAERCMEFADRFMRKRKYEEVEKFARKAQKLYPTKRAEDLLAEVTVHTKENQKSDSAESNVRKRQNCAKDGTHFQNSVRKSPELYSKEQLAYIEKIKKCKDYYEILGVSKDATDSDIKKAYKKLALQLHPDKNKAPGTAEAFKAIVNAVTILTDPEKRRQYDTYGPEEERMQNVHTRQGHTHYNYTRGFEAFITPEELAYTLQELETRAAHAAQTASVITNLLGYLLR
ncbi:dnaJ homolog subfamily B member 12-like isoform X2 [Temnothorax longispinosus]|uniref:dnaJ homolog subfamily B member 12-like isoform X2 n=1 Tax=Temnothorax longispinosus TaxID=300112 RepID=UPI003A9A329E